MKKTFVLDTNVLLHNSACIEAFADNTVVIPMPVIEELDRFKTHNDELGRNARQVIRRLDALRSRGHLGDGVPMDNGGLLKIIGAAKTSPSDFALEEEIPDNRIIRVAYHLFKKGERVIFVSKDINARLKSDALGIEAMDFEKQKVNFDELYTGFRQVRVPAGAVDDFLQSGQLKLETEALCPNEFVVLEDEAQAGLPAAVATLQAGHSAIGRSDGKGRIRALSGPWESVYTLKPRSKEQRMALELLMDENLPLVTLVGQAGTGKTLLALAAGLEQVLKLKRYDKLLVSRPIMPLGKDIGYLPGDKDAKLANWMMPIFDNLAYLLRDTADPRHTVRERIDKLQKDHILDLEALTYIRGRSVMRQYVIIDEAQNLTPHEIKTIISRAGEGTKMVITGDPSQIDNPYLDANSNGLSYAVEHLKTVALHGHVTLTKSERSTLAAVAADKL